MAFFQNLGNVLADAVRTMVASKDPYQVEAFKMQDVAK